MASKQAPQQKYLESLKKGHQQKQHQVGALFYDSLRYWVDQASLIFYVLELFCRACFWKSRAQISSHRCKKKTGSVSCTSCVKMQCPVFRKLRPTFLLFLLVKQYIYIYIFGYACSYIRICIYICIYILGCMYVYIYIFMYVCM